MIENLENVFLEATVLAAGYHPYPPVISDQYQLEITDYGPKDKEKRREFSCEIFNPSLFDIREFFHRAKYPINDTHYEYSWGNCYVKGTASLGEEVIEWELQDSSLGMISFPNTPMLLVGTHAMTFPSFYFHWLSASFRN